MPKPLLRMTWALASSLAPEVTWQGSLWAGKHHYALETLSSSHGAAGVKDWQMGSEKSHLPCALCGHTPPGLANTVFMNISLSFGRNSNKHAVFSPRKAPLLPCSPYWAPSGKSHPWWCGSWDWPSHLCIPALHHPSTHADTWSTSSPQIPPGRCTDP